MIPAETAPRVCSASAALWSICLLAFNEAAAFDNGRRIEQSEYYFETGILPASAKKDFTVPLITHGVGPNRKVLETIAQYSVEQGLTPKVTKLEDIFAPSTVA